MNQEEILNMSAGIEMDMLIATKVFNRKPHPSKNKILGQVGRYVSPRHYSIAIMSAWEVAETLSDKFDFAIVMIKFSFVQNEKFSVLDHPAFSFVDGPWSGCLLLRRPTHVRREHAGIFSSVGKPPRRVAVQGFHRRC